MKKTLTNRDLFAGEKYFVAAPNGSSGEHIYQGYDRRTNVFLFLPVEQLLLPMINRGYCGIKIGQIGEHVMERSK